MKKNVKFLLICYFFLLSFNTLSEIILSNENTTFLEFTQEIEKNIKEGTMDYIKNQQCFISNYKMFYKNSKLDHLNIYATCIEVNPNEKIDWDYPKISSDAEIKTIYVYGVDFAQKMLNDLKRKKSVLLIEKLAYYKKNHKKYRKGEYYYYK